MGRSTGIGEDMALWHGKKELQPCLHLVHRKLRLLLHEVIRSRASTLPQD